MTFNFAEVAAQFYQGLGAVITSLNLPPLPDYAIPILEKIVLGLTLAAPIGPISVEMIKRGLRHGFWAAFSVRIGGAFGQTLCLVGTYYGLGQLMGHPQVLNTLGIIGALLLVYMGLKTIFKNPVDLDLTSTSTAHNGILWGFYLAIFNPVSLMFWPGIFAASMGADAAAGGIAGLMLNLYIIVGVVLWGFMLSCCLLFGNKILNKGFINIITKLAGLFMVFYGLKYAYKVLGQF